MIKVTDQVVYMKPYINRTRLVQIGTVVSITGSNALVDFPGTSSVPKRITLRLDQLEPVSKRFNGRALVDINPVTRQIR